MARCPSCGAEVAAGGAPCPACGAAALPASTLTMRGGAAGRPVVAPAPVAAPPPASDQARFLPGTVLNGRYRVVALVGRGGMGEVYRADDLKLAHPVALKFLPARLAADRAALARLLGEVRVARQVSHPNACRVFDADEAGGHPFLAMEYIDGEDLATLLRRIGRVPHDKAVELARQICAGLAAAHDAGVLHRDLKPANVMIDGRGRARITDFGLASLGGDLHADDLRAGTPAYMAPEQLAGREVSVRSDLYSLGLVLHELFTGQRASAASTAAPARALDPLVERVILQCLETDPAERPGSAREVAARLPGGDPLAAALAAGETPSPEMVAAAPRAGALRPAVAAACLAGVGLALAGIVVASGGTRLHRLVPLDKPPAVLAERAGEIAAGFGYGPAADRAYGFAYDDAYVLHEDRAVGAARWDRFAAGQPLAIHFWYRQSPRPLETLRLGPVTERDPPLEVAGMATVVLDPRGRLVEFTGVPPQAEPPEGGDTPPVDWSAVFAAAGLSLPAFTPANPAWTPPTFADRRAAWTGTYADFPEVPIRVEAAAYRDRPVYFRIVAPWDQPARDHEVAEAASGRAGYLLFLTVAAAVVAGGILLARRNLRQGRGDRRGATRLAAVVFASSMLGWLAGADHVPTVVGEVYLFAEAAAQVLTLALVVWVLYLALEPYVRRLWPNLIISWTRLLGGRWRDPMVGRDVLLGGLLGLCHTVAILSGVPLARALGIARPPIAGVDLGALRGLRGLLAVVLGDSLPTSVLAGFGFLFVLLLLYALLRRERAAAAALWLLIATAQVLLFTGGHPWPAIVSILVIAFLVVVTVARLGLLAMIAFQLFFTLSFHIPTTSDLSSWYAQNTVLTVVVMAALAVYGYRISVAGQPLFRAPAALAD